MKITTLHNRLIGEWVGESRLWCKSLPNPESSCDSRLVVTPIARGKFLSFAYTWQLEGEAHEGCLLVGNENAADRASAAWGDSWHQGGNLLVLEGTVEESGEIVLNGTFPVPPQPDWGWKITIQPQSPEGILLTMYIIPPDGAEELAVRAEYKRVP